MNAPSATPRPSNNLTGPPPNARSAAKRFPKSSRILKTADFRRVYELGFKYTSRLFAAFCLDTADPARATGARAGFTVPRAIGKAVKRNRIKRRMREALRLDLAEFGPQWDLVFNPRRAMLDAPFDEVRSEVRKLISKCKR